MTQELLLRAYEIIRSAYACPEWLQYGRSARTDDTLKLIEDRIVKRTTYEEVIEA